MGSAQSAENASGGAIETPQMPDGMEMPEMPDGEMPELPDDMKMPDFSSVSGGAIERPEMPGGGSFGAQGEASFGLQSEADDMANEAAAETETVSAGIALSDLSSEAWLLLASSAAVLLAGIFVGLLYRRW